MKNIDLKMIAKVILIAGIILCGVAQILPWGELDLLITEELQEQIPVPVDIKIKINFFHWGGMQISPKFPNAPEWFLTPTDFSGISDSPEIYGIAFGTLFLYFIIPLGLISVITGIFAYRKVERKHSKNSLHAAVSSIVAIFFFIIFMQLTYLSNIEGFGIEGFSANYYWSPGFYLMIISAILFFISYTLIRRNYKERKIEQMPKKETTEDELKKKK